MAGQGSPGECARPRLSTGVWLQHSAPRNLRDPEILASQLVQMLTGLLRDIGQLCMDHFTILIGIQRSAAVITVFHRQALPEHKNPLQPGVAQRGLNLLCNIAHFVLCAEQWPDHAVDDFLFFSNRESNSILLELPVVAAADHGDQRIRGYAQRGGQKGD